MYTFDLFYAIEVVQHLFEEGLLYRRRHPIELEEV